MSFRDVTDLDPLQFKPIRLRPVLAHTDVSLRRSKSAAIWGVSGLAGKEAGSTRLTQIENHAALAASRERFQTKTLEFEYAWPLDKNVPIWGNKKDLAPPQNNLLPRQENEVDFL